MMIWQKRFFVGALALAAAGLAPAFAAPAVSVSAIVVKQTMADGSVRTYKGSDAKNVGDIVTPNFVEHNAYIFDQAHSFWVFFRPDGISGGGLPGSSGTSTGRVEVDFEYENPFKPKTYDPVTKKLLAEPDLNYTVEVDVNGVAVKTVAVPNHHWATRWRYQSMPRPIVHSLASLKAANALPPYVVTDARMKLPPAVKPYTGPMSSSSITLQMGNTGQRYDIGVEFEQVAAFIVTGNAVLQQSVFDLAEAAASVPCAFRDPATGTPLDLEKYPKATTYSNTNPLNQLDYKSLSPFQYDAAHHPSLSFVAGMETDDIYDLEQQQFYANMMILFIPQKPGHIFDTGQVRALAWSLRTAIELQKMMNAMPKAPGLFPRATADLIFANNVAWLTSRTVLTDPTVSRFYAGAMGTLRPNGLAYWQYDYLNQTLGAGVAMGFPQLKPLLQFFIKSDLKRTDGVSGWPRSVPTVYHTVYLNAAGNVAADWSELAALSSAVPTPSGNIDFSKFQDYTNGTTRALSIAVRFGGIQAPQLAWLNAQIAAKPMPIGTFRTSF